MHGIFLCQDNKWSTTQGTSMLWYQRCSAVKMYQQRCFQTKMRPAAVTSKEVIFSHTDAANDGSAVFMFSWTLPASTSIFGVLAGREAVTSEPWSWRELDLWAPACETGEGLVWQVPAATPDLVHSVTLSLNNTRECSSSKGFLSGYIMEELPQRNYFQLCFYIDSDIWGA